MEDHRVEGLIVLAVALLTVFASTLDMKIALLVSVAFLILYGAWRFHGR